MSEPPPLRLSPEACAERLRALAGWALAEDARAIVRRYRFADFVEAFSFMTKVALLAERANHHPEWSNVYDRVEVRLTTHDADGVSDRDFSLAAEIDRVAVSG
jgi:4a-hydroxytetrahydrobiopterin dehydratase